MQRSNTALFTLFHKRKVNFDFPFLFLNVQKIVIIVLFCVLCVSGKSERLKVYFIDSSQTIIDSTSAEFNTTFSSLEFSKKRPTPLLQLFKRKQRTNKKITAAILAFPFPFGIVGLHRIYLGTAPYVPVVYIASLGGAFGILPFIDFCVIALDKDIKRYQENKKVFMWVN